MKFQGSWPQRARYWLRGTRATAALRRIALIASVTLLTLPSQAWSQAVCANPGSSGGGTISGIVDDYFQGNGPLAAGATTLTLGTQDTRGAGNHFAQGDLLLILQMQDGTINASNDDTYGDGTGVGTGTLSVGNAGLYEFVTVTVATTGTTGDILTFAPGLTHSYTQADATATLGQKRYQVVRVPQYTAITAAGITAPPWGLGTAATGETGGVAAVDVQSTLTLGSGTVEGQTNRAFFLAGKGFRGGAGDISAAANGSNADWMTDASSTSPPTAPAYLAHGGKGEGIAGTPRFFVIKDKWGFQSTNDVGSAANLPQTDSGVEGYPGGSHARGAPGNAGGGGTDGRAPDVDNDENAGGGGGGNYAAGGLGGRPWNAPLVDSDGRGGAGYAGTVEFDRLFMGGGGGSGSTNNGTSDPGTYLNQAMGCNLGTTGVCSSGAAGGGIVIVRAAMVAGSGVIDVRGAHAYNTLNDAAGGGGAGGSVVIYSINGGAASIDASGGDGGNAWAGHDATPNTGDRHGPGGGGGGGFVVYSPLSMSVNATLLGGQPGITTDGTDTYSSTGYNGGQSTFQIPDAPGTLPGALCTTDLHLSKTDGVTTLNSPGTDTYTLTATNASDLASSGTVTVVDVLPAGLSIASGSVPLSGSNSADWTCSAAGNVISCSSAVAIAGNGSSTFAFGVNVVGPNGTAVDNQAAIGGGGDPNKPAPTAGTASACTGNDTPAGCAVDADTIQAPLLSLTKSDGTDTVVAGTSTTYILTVTNNGAIATSSTPVQVVDVLPTGLSYTGSSPFNSGGFACTYASPDLTCTSATPIAAGSQAAISFPVAVASNAPGAVTNLAQVGGGGDPGKPAPTPASAAACPAPQSPATTSSDAASGCAGDTDSVQFVNLALTKSDGQSFVDVGGQTTYVFTVTNSGTAASLGTINFLDVLPAGLSWPASLTLAGANAANWSCVRVDAQTAQCSSTVSIAAGTSSQFSLIASAAGASAGTQYINKAQISGGGDGNLLPGAPTSGSVGNCLNDNNPLGCATDLDTAQTAAEIRLSKTHANPQAVNPGASVAFTLTVSNIGGTNSGGANTVQVIDVLPASLTYSGATPFTSSNFGCAVVAQTITCNNTAAITAGSTAPISFSAVVGSPVGNTIVNPAQVGTTGADPQNSSLPTATTAAACVGNGVPSVGCAVDTVPLNADLQMAKTQALGTAGPFQSSALTVANGQTMQFQLVITNAAGSATVNTASFSDVVPVQFSGLSIVSTTGAGGAVGCDMSHIGLTGNNLSGVLTSLPAGATCAVVLQATAATNGSGIVNTAVVTAPAGINDTNPSNNSSSVTANILPQPILSLQKSLPNARVASSDQFVLSIAGSGGPVSVTTTGSVGAITSPPASLTASSGTAYTLSEAMAAGSASPLTDYTSTISCTNANVGSGTVLPGGSGTSFVLTPGPGDVIACTLANSGLIADLSITKTDGVSSVVPGLSDTYTIAVSNSGPSNVSGANVVDNIPGALLGAVWSCVPSAGASCTGSGVGSINDIVTIPVGGTLTYTVQGTVSGAATGTLVNTASVTAPSGTTDPNLANNTATDSDTLTPQADLSITKTDGVTSVIPGAADTYTITVSNNGPSNATGATVSDSMSASLIGVTWTCIASAGGTCSSSGSGNINDTVNVAVGATLTYTVHATVNPSATGTLVNTAIVTAPSGTNDPNPANNSATDTDTLTPQVDLSITKTDGVTSVVAGTADTYTITVSNNGPSNATGASVSDIMPASLTGVTWTCAASAGGTCSSAGTGNINATVNVAVGATLIYTVHATISPTATGSLVNVATVTAPSGTTDTNPSNNSATDSDTITAQADLAITKTDGTTTYTPGGTTTYTIVVTNATGPSSVTGATVTDTLSASIASATWTASYSAGASGPASGTGSISALVNLAVGSSATFTVVAHISSSATGNLSNTATVTVPTGTTDPTPGNNTATDTDTATPSADLAITKTDGVTTVVPGVADTYIITVSNNGPSNAIGATVADVMPAAFTAVNWSCAPSAGSACTASGVGNISDSVTVPAGGTVTYTVHGTVSATATGNLVNTATVTAPPGTTDSNPANNSATDTDTLTPQVDLTITKTDGVTSVTPGTADIYTITVSNNGPSNATGATVTDIMPASLTGVTWTCAASAGGTCTGSGTGNINDTVNVAVGATLTYAVHATVSPTATGSLSNTATVSAPGGATDTNPANNSSTDTDALTPHVDLAITKTDGVTSVTPGTVDTYTITVSNTGPSNVTGASVVDNMPVALTGVTWTCAASAGGTCTGSGTGNINDVVNVAVGATLTYTVHATISPTATGSLVNTATVSAPGGTTDTNPANNSATDTDTLASSADVSVTKSGPATVTAGAIITYTLVVSNAGPSEADGSKFSDTVPAAITGVSASCGNALGGAACGATGAVGNLVSGTVTTLPPGGSVQITITGTAPLNPTSFSNTASVNPPTGTSDPVPGNNTSPPVVTTIVASADIALTKTVDNPLPNVGDQVTFTITAKDNGPSDATGVVVSDALPAGLALVSDTPSAGTSYSSVSGLWTIGSLNNGANATLLIVATVTAPGPITNVATKTAGDQPDPVTSNNTAGAGLNANPSADIQITKSVDNPAPNVGSNVTFTVTATDAGPDNATGVVVTDLLPAGLTYVSSVPSQGAYNSATGVWTIGNVNNGASATLAIVATVNVAATSITNTATKTGENEHDPAPGNNQAGATLNGQQADVQVLKTVDHPNPLVGDTIHFTITTTNNGPSAASGVQVTDVLPAGLGFVSAAASPGTTYNNLTGLWNVGSLAASGSAATVSLTITATVQSPGLISNTAAKTAEDQPDPNTTNDSSTASLNANPVADLVMAKSVDTAAPEVGATVNFTLTLTNDGPDPSAGVQVSDLLPAGLLFVSDVPSAGTSYNPGTGVWTVGTLNNGAFVTLTIAAQVTTTGSITNTATASSTTFDPNTGNNTASASVNSSLAAATTVGKSFNPASILAGGTSQMSITLTNPATNSVALTGVAFTDTYPGSLVNAGSGVVVSNSCGGTLTATANANSASLVGVILPPNSTCSIVLNVTDATAETITNSTGPVTSVNAAPGGPATAQLQVMANLPLLVGTKTATPNPVNAGGQITYTLSLQNTGTAAATNAVLSDPLPPNTTFVSAIPAAGWTATTPGVGTSGTVTFNDASFAVGGPASFTIVVAVNSNTPGGTQIVNSAIASSDTGAPGTLGPASVTVQSIANLAISKSDGALSYTPGGAAVYTISVSDSGPSDAQSVQVSDALPGGVTLTGTPTCVALGSATCGIITGVSGGGSFSASGAGIAAGAGNSLAYALPVKFASGLATDPLVNTAIASAANDPNSHQAQDSDALNAQSSLAITKDDGSATYTPGGTANYSIVVTNTGASDAGGIAVSDSLPAGVTLAGTPTCTSNGTATCGVIAGNIGDTSFSASAATLASGAGNSLTYHVPVTFDPALTAASLTNTASVSAPSDPGSPHSASDTDTLSGITAITLAKTDNSAFYTPGGSAIYVVTVGNNGPSDAHAISVSDTLPTGATVAGTVTCVPTGNADCGSVGGTSTSFSASGAAVAAGTGNALVFSVPVQFAANMTTDPLVNTASASDPNDPNAPATASDSDVLAASSGLSISKNDGSATYTPGGTATYTVSVLNSGPSDANSLSVSDALPAGVTLTGTPTCTTNGTATCGTIAGVIGGANFSASGASIAAGAGNSVSYAVPVAFASNMVVNPLVNTAIATDPSDPGQHTSSDSDTLKPVTALAISKDDGSLTYTPGTAAIYTVTVTNAGLSDSTAVSVTDSLPPGVSFSATPTCTPIGTATCATVIGNAGELAFSSSGGGIAAGAGNALVFSVPVQFAANLSTNPLVNTASASDASGAPPVSGSDSDALLAFSGLTITKDDGSATYVPGGGATYSVVLTNAGPSDATGVSVSDPLPAGVTLSAVPGCVASGAASCGALSGSIGATSFGATNVSVPVGPGNSVTFTVPVNFASSLNANPLANVVSATDPSTGLTVTATDADVPNVQTSLIVVKDDGQTSYTPGGTAIYTITVANGGPSDSTAVVVGDTLPAGVTLTSAPSCVANGTAICGTLNGSAGGSSVGVSGASIAAGAGNSLTLLVPVAFSPNLSTDPLVNTATATDSSGAPPATGSDSDTRIASSGFTITKTDGSPTYTPGNTATYTIAVGNAGPSDADAVTLSDPLPTGVTLTGAPTCIVGGLATCGTISGTGGATSFGTSGATIPVGASLTYFVPVVFDASLSSASLTNTATVSDANIPNSSRNASDTDTLAAQADLSITKTDNTSFYTPGSNTTYTIVVHNAGPSAVTAATVSDPLPAGTITAAWSCIAGAGASCTPTGSGAINDSVTLPANASVTYLLTLAVPAGFTGNLINTATVATPVGVTDTNPGNNSATDTDTQGPQPDLTISKSHGSDFAQGEIGALYTITVSNIGAAPSSGLVTVIDTLPTGLTATAIGGTNWSCDLPSLTCTRSDALGANASYPAITLTVNVAANAPTQVTNVATVAGGGDTTPGNDSASDPTTITSTSPASADLNIVKNGPASVPIGGQVSYTITVTNNGPDTAVDAIVDDPAPFGLTFLSAGPPCDTGFPCNLGNLIDGQQVIISDVVFAVPSGYALGTIVNVASVSSQSPDPTPNNNTSTVSTAINTSSATPKPAPIDARWMLLAMMGLLAGVGAWRARARG